jgi:caffeoyl-CoA O-methyltransferase
MPIQRCGREVEDLLDEVIEEYAKARTRPEPQLLQELIAETEEKFGLGMLTGRVEGRLLKLLVQLSGASTILELGTYTGYSALSMAEGLPDDGQLITCENKPEHAEVARKYFDRSPHGNKIQIKMGDALDTIKELAQEGYSADLVFLDADKIRYPLYYEHLIELLNPGGLIIVDNALWGGEVLNPDDQEAEAIARLNDIMLEDDRIENVLLTVRDGVMIGRKAVK